MQAVQKQERANFEKGTQVKDKEAQETIRNVDAELLSIQAEYTRLQEKLANLEQEKAKIHDQADSDRP